MSQTFSATMTNDIAGPEDKTGFGFIGRSLRRHWRGTTAMAACLSAVSIGIIAILPPTYSSVAYLQVQSRPNVVSIPDVAPSVALDVGGISSEVEILKSPEMARAVATKLRLTEIPGSKPSAISAWIDQRPGIKELKEEAKKILHIPTLTPEERVVSFLFKNQWIKQVGRSRVVQVGFVADDPEVARDVANAYAEAYIERQEKDTLDSNRSAKDWVESEIARVQKLVETNERKFEEFRSRHGLTENDHKLLLPYGQLADLERNLTQTVADQAMAQSRVDAVRRLQRAGTLLEATPESLNSPSLRALREQEAQLTIEADRLLQRYSPDSGRVHVVMTEKAQLQRSIRGELDRIAQGLQSEADMASTRVASLKGSVANAKNNLQLTGAARVEFASLQRQTEADRQVLVTLMKRRSELTSKASLQSASGRLVSTAPLPTNPAFPQMLPMAALAMLASIAASAGMTVGRDLKQRTIRSTDELAGLVPYRALGILPRFQPVRKTERLASLSGDRTRYSEAVKNIYVRVCSPDHPLPRTIMVTSALSGEGKTTTAVSLAMLAASLGRKVLIVDMDTRAPSVHHIFQLALAPGFSELTTGHAATMSEVVHTPHPNLAVLPAGSVNGFNMLANVDRIDALLGQLSDEYDHIIIDTPPCLAVVDTVVLGRMAERIVHVVQWARTSREMVKAVAKMFDRIDPSRVGVLLSQVDVKRHAAEGYTDSVYYHNSLNRYYLG